MSNQPIQTSGAPAAIGPYSQGIAAGNTAYVSGQLPIDPATGEFAGPDIASQTRRSLQNVEAILAAQGMGMKDVVKTTVLLADIADFAAMNEVYGEFFSAPYPARAAFQVAALPKGARVEIEAVAVK
ncbi:MAG: RidA family protein [Angelakisella sp.]|jgi:2-iminobutanoate/2-iminopropanoate deaminase|nr:RidA family protein [Angelakisella sp.]MCI9529868.1 RidA family protein [Angelakisella sp.]